MLTATMQTGIADWDLFLDESGSFEEFPSASGGAAPPFSNQIAGFLAPHGGFGEREADALLEAAFSAALLQSPPAEVHGVDLFHGRGAWSHLASWPERRTAYASLINALVLNLQAAGLQPLRLVNIERIPHRDRIEAQVAMTAALVGRIALTVARSGAATVRLFLHLARVTIPAQTGTIQITRQDYERALQTELALLLAKHDLPANRWQAIVESIGPAAASRRLQISDLISHASHANFAPCADTAAERNLRAALQPFDLSLALPLALEQAERSLADGEVATSLQLLAQREMSRSLSKRERQSAADLEARAVARLASLSDNARNQHLEQLLAWIRRLISERSRPALSVAACDWIAQKVESPLLRQLPAAREIAWFRLSLRAWLLTVHNQNGQLLEGRHVADQLKHLLIEIAGRWEYSDMLLGALVTIAVHEIDCREFDSAAARSEAVARFYEELSELFAAELPDIFPAQVRSSLRGKAMGTALQARLHRGLRGAEDLAAARQLSDAALAEFESKADRSRQHQYRAFLETLAGNYPGARNHLGRALDVAGEHEAIGAAIAALPPVPQGFPLLHWIRLGAAAGRGGNVGEASAFRSAFDRLGLRRSIWCRGQTDSFPVQGILLHLAAHDAACGDPQQSLATLWRLAASEARTSPAIGVIVAAAFALAAGLLWRQHQAQAQRALFAENTARRALDRILPPIRKSADPFHAVCELLDALAATLSEIRAGEIGSDEIPNRLLAAADEVII
jgi:hypothetical protein